MKGAAWQIANLLVIRSGKTILKIDHLDIKSGEFINLIGTNGAGKTTFLKVLCGLLKPSKGTVQLNGINLFSQSSWKRCNLRKHIGYIPQAAEYNTNLPFTVREIVAMGRTSLKPLLKKLDKTDYQYVDQWLEKVGLEKQKNQTFRSLSGGEQQKTLIARAMVQNPGVLLLDEPTSHLDFHWKFKINHFIQTLHSELNLTILLISHEIDSIASGEYRTILLDAGKIFADGNSETVLTSRQIQQAYQCKMQVVELHGKKYIINEGATS
ncbi:ATP-binding cassette domain-containing protein [candidate division KSB1 bacterium]|nr:ATP-binding cassette domain-containing protein [candidate division KSB1 bacterium]